MELFEERSVSLADPCRLAERSNRHPMKSTALLWYRYIVSVPTSGEGVLLRSWCTSFDRAVEEDRGQDDDQYSSWHEPGAGRIGAWTRGSLVKEVSASTGQALTDGRGWRPARPQRQAGRQGPAPGHASALFVSSVRNSSINAIPAWQRSMLRAMRGLQLIARYLGDRDAHVSMTIGTPTSAATGVQMSTSWPGVSIETMRL